MSHIDPASFNNYNIDFGVVAVGTTVVKSYPIKNTSYNAIVYYVTRNKHTNPIYYVFDVNKYEFKIQTGEEFRLKITYSPNLPGHKDFDYFTVTDNHHHYFRLRFKGECKGPSVTCSVRNLIFSRTPKRKISKHLFTLTNISDVPATYNFDCAEEEQGLFKVEPTCGSLAPQATEYISLKFVTQTTGFYSRQLFCLILHHEPIVLNLFGIYTHGSVYDQTNNNIRYYPFPHEDTVGFKGYFSDSVTVKRVPPPVSLTVNYLDFGRMMPESSCQTLTTSFTNHMLNEVEVEWENVKLFRIYPEKLKIPPKQSALYECRFQPNEICNLSAAILNGHVSWGTSKRDNLINVPIPITLRLIGHSFPLNQLWIPSVTITPSNVILPLSLPNFCSWTTFMIKNTGHLPVLYKLVPPRKSNFLMKPMVGLIRTHAIIAVQLEGNCSQKQSYIEQWHIELNGQLQKCVPIYVKAQTDVPCVRVAKDDSIYFRPMQPGSQSSLFVPVRNVSNCWLQFQFILCEQFVIDPAQGVLAPNEEIFVTAIYTSDIREHGVIKMAVSCQLQCILKEESFAGELLTIPVTVIAEVVYAELCGLPQTYECNEVEWGTVITTCFHIFNFGETDINFKLCHNHNLKDVILNPEYGKCGPREKLAVRVKFHVQTLGKNVLMIGYNNRFSEYSYECIGDEGVKILYQIEYKSSMPMFQIMDLQEHNYSLFNSEDLWTLLNIDGINAALMETNEGEIRRVDLRVPDFELGSKLFYLVFLIKNISNLPTRLGLKRRQVCDCEQRESDESFTFRVKYFDCPHKDMLEIKTSQAFMPPNSFHTLVFNIRYLLPDENVLSYKLDFCHDRTVILNVYINSIDEDYLTLSVYKEDLILDMGYVYIGLREPPVFAYWLYNSTSFPVSFKVDDLNIVRLCNDDRFPVLKCLNCSGLVQPFTTAPVLFKFWPIEEKTYRVSVPLLLGKKETILTIQGEGTIKKSKFEFGNMLCPEQRKLRNSILSLSVNYIITEPLIASTSTERMIFIRHHSKTQRIQYKWKPCFVDGLVKIEPSPPEGLIQRNESHPVIIKISSMQEPCSVRVLLQMEFVDIDEVDEYHKKVKESQENWGRKSCKSQSELELFIDVEPVPEPRHFVIALPIFVNVVGTLDRDTCITIEQQMKQQPRSGTLGDLDDFVTDYFKRKQIKERPICRVLQPVEEPEEEIEEVITDKNVTENVMENLIGDALYSKYLLEVLNNLKTEPSPTYSQIKLNKCDRDQDLEKQTRKVLRQPELPEVADICQEVILDTLQAVFRVGCKPKTVDKQ